MYHLPKVNQGQIRISGGVIAVDPNNMTGSGTIGRCVLVGLGMASLEEECPCGK